MSLTRLEQIAELYNTSFPMGWDNTFVWDEFNGNDSLNAIRDKVSLFEQDVFFLFSQSVLSGEYLSDKDFPNKIDSLYEVFSNGELLDDDTSPFKTIAIRAFSSMIYEFCRVLKSLRYLLTMLNNKYEERPTKYIVNAYRVRGEKAAETNFGRYYFILLEITQIDHFLSYDKRTISNLIIYHSELTKGKEDKNLQEKNALVLSILNEKTMFLLKKLLIEDNKEFDFLIDFEHKHYDAGKFPFTFFFEMDRQFEFYCTENYSNESLGVDLDIKAHNKSLKIGQFSLLMKYYKDSKNTDVAQIENILKEFDKMHEELLMEFTKRPLDRYALSTLKNYMYNCRFSFMMQDSSYTFEQLQKDLNEIINIQYQTGILNFYPYRKAFNKALQLLHDNKTLEKAALEGYNRFLRLCISKFSEAILWCREYRFYPIQIGFRECLVNVDGFGDVFIASSFCRPVKYSTLDDELNTFKNQALLVENEIALREEKKELKALKMDIDNSKTKQIEILSVFSAIITFLFGSISFFAENKNNDFIHLLYSVFGLGAVLLIFISGIHLITMRKEEKFFDYFKHPRALFCLITIAFSIVLLFWLVRTVVQL